MKILQLPTYFFPEQISSSHLSIDLNEAYDNAGFTREVYVPTPCRGISKSVRKEYKKKRLEILNNGLITVHRFSMYSEGHNPVMRALRYFLICIKQFNRAIFCAKDIDLIFMSSTPPINGLLGALIKKCKRIPFIYNLQDIFPDSLVSTGLAKQNGILWKIGRIIENYTYRNADKIIVISQDFKKNIMKKGVPEEKIEVIYNWVDANKVKPTCRKENPLYNELGLDRDKFYVVYAGNLGKAQNIEIIIDSAKETRCNSKIIYLIFGRDNQIAFYKNQIDNLGLSNIKLFPLQPLNKISYVYGLGNISIVSCKKGFGSIGMPSKFVTIMSSGTAVLASFDSNTELQYIIDRYNVGLFTEADNKEAFKDAVIYLSENTQLCEDYGRNGRQFVLDNFTKEVATEKYVCLIKGFSKKDCCDS